MSDILCPAGLGFRLAQTPLGPEHAITFVVTGAVISSVGPVGTWAPLLEDGGWVSVESTGAVEAATASVGKISSTDVAGTTSVSASWTGSLGGAGSATISVGGAGSAVVAG